MPTEAPQAAVKEEVLGGFECSLVMKDGAKLCRAFQIGTCRNNDLECQHGAHKCAVLISKAGRVCGLKNHGAWNHRS